MRVLKRFQSLRPAVQFLGFHAGKTASAQKDPLHIVFDIDDTIIFDNARGTPNAQMMELLRHMHAAGHKIHLVTARSTSYRSATLAELARAQVPYHTLDLATEKQRESMATIAAYKFQARSKYKPVFLTVGDQWGDLIQIEKDEDLDALDVQHQTDEWPWQIVSVEDGICTHGLKLMASKS